ncbi:GNAT family N-acetyltransferase [Kribbella qitaiheensis]|uniref:GNAT family N-acetyltransferase n=2 Tax=Kribbella qitaiheensis TaxID=1544730 RepID=A0A7G6XA56_9ACTN|nr:GNAT family N-acetyltransferase [Kribbella qitaiheensis]
MTIALANHPTAAAGPGYRVEFETVASPDRAEPAGPEHGVERAAGAAEHGVERAAEYGAEPAAGAAEHGVERGVAAAEYGVVELVRVVDEAGGVAARGMVGVVGMDAVMHDIHTEPAHRRRGLGSVVMAALSRRAVERGATTGLLMATYDGVQLYRRLEWLPRATMLTGSGLRAAGTEGGDLRPVLASR